MQTLQEVEDGEGAVQAPGPGDAPSAKAAGNEEAAAPPKSTYAVAWPMGYTPSQDQLKAVQDICDKYMGDKGPDVLDKIWREIREKNLYPFDFAGQGRVA